MKRIGWLFSAALVSAACGHGDSTSPSEVAVDKVSVTLPATVVQGNSVTAIVTVADANGNALSGRDVSWSSSNQTIAAVGDAGVVTGVAPGTATITATSGGKSGSAIITVLPPPVATVIVGLSKSAIVVSSTAVASAVLKDASGNTLTGRTVEWTSSAPTVVSVGASGIVTGLAPGTATILASSEGKTGSAPITVLAPVATVLVAGSQRVKVGDTYSYTVTARLGDGTIVERPITWSISDPSMGAMTPTGELVPAHVGSITLQARIDDVIWELSISSYDWRDFTSNGYQFSALAADVRITNQFGTSEYPDLVFTCAPSGYFLVWVSFQNFVTHDGVVAYNFDGGPITTETWDELEPDYSTLWYHGNNVQTKTFASRIVAAHSFGFAFTEYNADARATIFRVTGLSTHLNPLLAACPSNSLDVVPTGAQSTAAAFLGAGAHATAQVIMDRQLRGLSVITPGRPPQLMLKSPVTELHAAARRP